MSVCACMCVDRLQVGVVGGGGDYRQKALRDTAAKMKTATVAQHVQSWQGDQGGGDHS